MDHFRHDPCGGHASVTGCYQPTPKEHEASRTEFQKLLAEARRIVIWLEDLKL